MHFAVISSLLYQAVCIEVGISAILVCVSWINLNYFDIFNSALSVSVRRAFTEEHFSCSADFRPAKH